MQLFEKVRTKKKKKKKKGPHLKNLGYWQNNPLLPVVPPWLYYNFAPPAAAEPKNLLIFYDSRRRRERKIGFLSKFSRRKLVYVSKLVVRGGGATLGKSVKIPLKFKKIPSWGGGGGVAIAPPCPPPPPWVRACSKLFVCKNLFRNAFQKFLPLKVVGIQAACLSHTVSRNASHKASLGRSASRQFFERWQMLRDYIKRRQCHCNDLFGKHSFSLLFGISSGQECFRYGRSATLLS